MTNHPKVFVYEATHFKSHHEKLIDAQNMYTHLLRDKTKWFMFIDADEFITTRRNPNKTIREELETTFKGADLIKIPWVMFGSNNHNKKPNGIIIDNYTKCEKIQNKHVKTMCRPRYVNKICIHGVELNKTNLYIDSKKNIIESPFNENYTIDLIQINHYWGKSEEDLKEKIERGRAPINKKREMQKNYHQMYNSKVDESLKNKYGDLIKKKMKELNLMK